VVLAVAENWLFHRREANSTQARHNGCEDSCPSN
jgi:hypothetical protein